MLGHVVAQEVGRHTRGERVHSAAEQEALEHGDHRLRRAEPAEPEPGAEDLRHGARADHPAVRIERVERGQGLALEADSL